MPHIKWEVNLGHIITIAGFLITGGIAYSSMDAKITANTVEIRHITDDRKELRELLDKTNARLEKITDEMVRLRVEIAKSRR